MTALLLGFQHQTSYFWVHNLKNNSLFFCSNIVKDLKSPLRKETTGYPTQKPEALLKRIIAAASLPNGLVIDPMCGSGTTLAAALKSGRRAAGGDISPISIEVVEKRLSTKHSSTPQPEGF